MKQNLLTFKSGLLTKLLLSFTLLLTGVGNLWADETLTINESSSNTSYGVPFNAGKLTTTGIYGEFLVLSSQISSLAGKNITGLTFYTNKAADWGAASFTVCLKEVDNTCYTSSTGPLGGSGTTTVYTGGLSASVDKEVSIIFDDPFTYSGSKSLLVRINCTNTTGTNLEVNFTGANGADWSDASYTSYGTTSSLARQRFQPKVTLSYTTPAVATLSIFPNEDADFGTVWASDSKDYVITNNSGSTVNVVPSITGDDKALFSVSPESADITSGSTQTFTLNFNYNANSLGDKEAIITFTPGGDSENAITKNITVKAEPKLQISSTDGAFGNVTADANKVYTITNHTGETISITPSVDGSDADMFSVSPDEKTDIDDGESQVFTVTFDWQADVAKLGEKTATVTLTPDKEYDGFNIAVSATAKTNVVLDEDNTGIATTGSNKSVYVKYTPSNGWNTICMPISLTNAVMNSIYGTGWKAYELYSYEDGILTFKKTSTLASATPYLVYIATATGGPFVLESAFVFNFDAKGITPVDTEATFQGTYTTKAYNSATDEASPWYGVTPVGKVMKAGSGASVKGYRAYFTGVSAPASGVKMMILEGDDETDLGFVKMVDENAKDVYTLTGQKVQKARKGIYIVNGKKVVIK